MKIRYNLLLASLLIFFTTSCSTCAHWKKKVEHILPEYGHRNWIVIADSAYPKQSASGIETIYTGANQFEVLEFILNTIDSSNHIRPVIMFDYELKFIQEKSAPGVETYRQGLKDLLGNRFCKELHHEDIIRKLDEASKLFNVLILKTDMTIPYSSVFIELDCGYWSADNEQKLIDVIRK